MQERSEADAADALDRSAILFVVVIPEGFSEALEAGEPTPLVFRQRGNGGDTGQIVAAIVRGIARDMAIDTRVRRPDAARPGGLTVFPRNASKRRSGSNWHPSGPARR